MKLRHNKKRNTAFVYEALVKEATLAVLKKDKAQRDRIVKIIKKHFSPSTLLHRDLGCYRSLYENQNFERTICEKIIKEAKISQRLIDPNGLFKQQSALIKDINTKVESDIFTNFVPNYKTLASIAQLFSDKLNPKDVIILENQIIEDMMKSAQGDNNTDEIDPLVVRTFIERFNQKYEEKLLSEQKELLSYYITSFTDNAVELKMFLNEEIDRLKNKLIEAKESDEIKNDSSMVEKTDRVLEKLNSFSNSDINESVLATVIKTQELVKEIYNNGDSN
jgi:hypothetical protein